MSDGCQLVPQGADDNKQLAPPRRVRVKCEELDLSESGPLCPTDRTSTRHADTADLGESHGSLTGARKPGEPPWSLKFVRTSLRGWHTAYSLRIPAASLIVSNASAFILENC
jgi:hypothetical protein